MALICDIDLVWQYNQTQNIISMWLIILYIKSKCINVVYNEGGIFFDEFSLEKSWFAAYRKVDFYTQQQLCVGCLHDTLCNFDVG